MKRLLFTLLCLLFSVLLFGQEIFKGIPHITSFDLLDDNTIVPIDVIPTYGDFIKLEVPDTIWVKRVKNPKEGRHYTLDYSYHGPFVGERFLVKKHEGYNYRDNLALYLQSISTGKSIIFKVGSKKYMNEVDVKDISDMLTDKYGGKSLYIPTSSDKYPPISSYKHIIVDSLVYRIGASHKFSQDGYIICIFGKDDDQSPIMVVSSDNKGKNVLAESEYNSRLSEYNLRRATAGSYHFILAQVTAPKNVPTKESSILKYYDDKYRYEDSIMKLIIEKTYTTFEFSLENKTSGTFKINWDEVVFVDTKNSSQRVIHQGIRYADAAKSQAPTIIAPGTILEDLLVPTSNIRISSVSGEWIKDDIIPRNSREGAFPEGTRVKIILPIETAGKIYEYTLVYNLVWEYTDPTFREQFLSGK